MLELVKYSSFIVAKFRENFFEHFSMRQRVPKTKADAQLFTQVIFQVLLDTEGHYLLEKRTSKVRE